MVQVHMETSNAQIYSEDFLQPNGTSQQFLNAISYSVNLQALLKFTSTCFYHENMEYAPMLMEIVDERLKKHYNGNYLLQVWATKGRKKYERVINYPIHAWNIQHDCLIYQLDQQDLQSEYVYIIDLENKRSTIQVKNFWNDPSYKHFAVSGERLFVANKNKIYIINIEGHVDKGQVRIIEPSHENVITYQIQRPNSLLGLFQNEQSRYEKYVMCAIETSDNQIDFVTLKSGSKHEVTFYQTREVVHRDLFGDPIIQFKLIIQADETQYCITRRASGKVDLYWNYTLVNSCDDKIFEDVCINFQTIFLIQHDQAFKIDTLWSSRISLDVSEPFEYNEKDFHKIYYPMICHHIQIASSICLFPTQFFVSHNSIVSMFDVIKKKWTKHFFFKDEIFTICRNEKMSLSLNNPLRLSNLGIFLKNGLVYVIDCDDDQIEWEITDAPEKLEGRILSIVSDWKTINTHYILTKLKNQYSIYGYSYHHLTKLNSQLNGVTSTMQVLRMFSHLENAHFALIDSEKQAIITYANLSASGNFNLQVKSTINIENYKKITGQIHTVIQTENLKYLVLVDQYNYYKLDIEQRTLHDPIIQNISNLFVIDGNNLYKMSNKDKNNKKSRAGLFYQDISSFINKDLDAQFDIDDAMVGVNGLIDYNEDNCRFAYLTDFEEVVIVPVLHRNNICFFGMKQRSEYLLFRKIDDKLIALDTDGNLTTWNVVTGKLLHQQKMENDVNLQDFEIQKCDPNDFTYQREWYQPIVLLRSIVPISDFNSDTFYDPEMLYSSLKNSTPLLQITKKEFHYFKIIEIVDQSQIKVHCTFIHPIYLKEEYYLEEEYHRIYFSQNLDYMLERLSNYRVFLYQRQDTETPDGLIKWKMVKRIQQFPKEISEACNANYLFSPDLMHYLDFNKVTNSFKIRNTLTQKSVATIPRDIMNPGENNEANTAKLFTWYENTCIKVISEEGMEKVLNVFNNFEEVAFGQIPMIDITQYQDQQLKRHYFYQKREASMSDSYLRLKRNFQDYKSAVYIQKQRKYQDLYNSLFTVDYQVDGCKGKPVSDLSFTFLHWRMIELMTDKTLKFNMDNVGSQEMKLLVMNILPCFNTLLHFAFKRLSVVRKVYQIVQLERKKAIKRAEKAGEEYNPVNGFLVPFIRNYQKKSPLHLALENGNYKAADTFLDNLKDEGIDNHSRAIYDVLPDCVAAELPSLGNYLDARFVQTKQIQELKTGCINYQNHMSYAITSGELWPDMVQVQNQLLKESPLDAEIKLEFLDVPAMHCYQELAGDRFFSALAESSQIQLFGHRSIQAIIDYKWPLAKEFTLKLLFIPFIIYHALFVVWSNMFFGQLPNLEHGISHNQNAANYAFSLLPNQNSTDTGNLHDHSWVDMSFYEPYILGNKIISAFLVFFSLYFLFNELRQLISNKLEFFMSFWNYTDLLPPIFILITVGFHFTNKDLHSNFNATIRAISGLLMWSKFLYFLRIFPSTGYIIKILHKVIVDMKVFMLILTIVYFAYNEAFLRISEMSDPDAQFFKNYADGLQQTYTMSLGNFIIDPLYTCVQPWLGFVLMITFTILTTIVMLNLLIAIISQSFEQINDNYQLANYSERAAIISENRYLIPNYKKVKFCPKNKYLVIATEKIDEGVEVIIENMPTKLAELEKNLEDCCKMFDKASNDVTLKINEAVLKFGI